MVESARGSRVAVYAQNMHEAPQGAFTGEVSAAMLTELEVAGVVIGHSERRKYFGESDRAVALKVAAALGAGLRPILCVGETEEERLAGETERKLRHQVQEGLEHVPEGRLGEVAIAYEPIWAIGTGQVATPEQAQDAASFIRALVAAEPNAAEQQLTRALRRLGDPGQRRRAARPPRRRRGARGRRLARAGIVRRDRRRGQAMTLPPGPESLPASSLCLIVLDGWGIAPPGPGNAISLARTPVYDELLASYPAHPARRLRARRRPARRARWATPRSATSTSAPAPSCARTSRGSTTRCATAYDGREPGDPRRARRARAASTCSGSSPTAACTPPSEHLLALIAIAGELGAGEVIVHAFTDGRDTGPHDGAQALERLERAGGARIGSVVGRYFAMDRDRRWDRTQRAYDLLVHARAPHRAASGVQAVRAAYERGETDEFIEPTLVGEGAPIAAGDRVFCFNFRPDRMREIVSALADPAFTEIDRGGAPAGLLARDDDRVRGGLALPGGVCARAPADHAGGGDRGDRRAPAARRRDREVPARDLLLRRRRGAAAARRAPRAGGLQPRGADLRLRARDERPGDRRRVRVGLAGGRSRASRSSTSPTPTWSATPA